MNIHLVEITQIDDNLRQEDRNNNRTRRFPAGARRDQVKNQRRSKRNDQLRRGHRIVHAGELTYINVDDIHQNISSDDDHRHDIMIQENQGEKGGVRQEEQEKVLEQAADYNGVHRYQQKKQRQRRITQILGVKAQHINQNLRDNREDEHNLGNLKTDPFKPFSGKF